jgi:hypothetical protein
MGELFIQKANGDTKTFLNTGEIIEEKMPLQMDFCDKCQQWQPLTDGRFESYEGLKILWFCAVCK